MTHEEIMEDMHATASNYADPEEHESITTVSGMHALFKAKFYALPKYEKSGAKARSNCKKCFGRGYRVPQGGGRLCGCVCLRKTK